MRITLRVAFPRRFLAVPARTSMTYRLPARSWRRSLADLILSFTFVPPLTFWKVENSGLPAVVRTRRRTIDVPAGASTVTGTPVVPTDAAVIDVGDTVAGATASACAANGTAA